jgi:Zn-finger nucleic acid-binding protein
MVEENVQHTVVIDRCPSCHGVVLDKGESEMIEALGLASVIEAGVAAPPEHLRASPARCHECARDMVALMGAGDVEYDWCDGCERLFFDKGELAAFDAFRDA